MSSTWGTILSLPNTPLGRAKEQARDPRCLAQGGETEERTLNKPTVDVTPAGVPGLWMEQGAELTLSRAQPCGQAPACSASDREVGSTARLFHVPAVPVCCRVETGAASAQDTARLQTLQFWSESEAAGPQSRLSSLRSPQEEPSCLVVPRLVATSHGLILTWPPRLSYKDARGMGPTLVHGVLPCDPCLDYICRDLYQSMSCSEVPGGYELSGVLCSASGTTYTTTVWNPRSYGGAKRKIPAQWTPPALVEGVTFSQLASHPGRGSGGCGRRGGSWSP